MITTSIAEAIFDPGSGSMQQWADDYIAELADAIKNDIYAYMNLGFFTIGTFVQ